MSKESNSRAMGFVELPKKKRKGIHAKTKQSSTKGSKNYKKTYRGQGRS